MVHTDDQDDFVPPATIISASKGEPWINNPSAQEDHQPNYLATNHNQQNINILINQEEIEQHTNPTALMLKVHYKLGHLPFSKIKIMAANGTLDVRMANCCIPICAACSYGKATRKPWRNQKPNHHIGSQGTTVPGTCVSVDQMESPIPRLVAHMKGNPTTCQYNSATIFVDHCSRMGYIHLQENLKADNTLQAKESFERHCDSFGIKIKQYHTDNRRFAEKAFIDNIHQKGQTITYCGVNVHFQNSIAEKCIRDLQDTARTMILHATAQWPKAM